MKSILLLLLLISCGAEKAPKTNINKPITITNVVSDSSTNKKDLTWLWLVPIGGIVLVLIDYKIYKE